MNKTKENTKTILYLLSLGIAFIVGTTLIGTVSAASPIFQETFENLDEWYLVVYDNAGGSYWDPAPRLDTTMGEPAPSLDVNGDSWCGDGAYTKETFDYTKGLVIEFDMYVASGYDWNWGRVGLSDHMPNLNNPRVDGAYVDPLRGDPSFIAGVFFTDDGNYNQRPPSLGLSIRAEDGTGDGYTYSSDASKYENEWHTYRISIQPDGYVEFYMNETLIWASTKKIDKTLSSMPLVLGSRDAYGPVRIDNVKVFQPETVLATCSDGTLYGYCSVNKPKYCDDGTLIDKCQICGCPPENPTCCEDETCIPEFSTIAIPVVTILGLLFLISRRKRKE